ncbi:MAG: tRNA (adenosine(37)-N6)-threonylcarbamoyltransferase complex ATPase subunit type 1 TsaE [Desulforhopalus sp.]
MKTVHLIVKDIDDTEKLGRLLGEHAEPGDVICLDGDLGAGKTALVQAIARGLAVPANCYVTSPSFAILHEYVGRLPLYHMDFYRLQGEEEIEDLGFEEYFYMEGITVIEWSRRAENILPKERLAITMVVNDDLSRTVTLEYCEKFGTISRLISEAFKIEGEK